MKTNERLPASGVLLAIDFGMARIGIARSDATQMLATPVDVLQVKNRPLDFIIERLAACCPADCVGLVFGWPDEDDVRTEPVRTQILMLAESLGERRTLPWALSPESFSSRDALDLLHASGKKMKPGQPIDAYAAAVILQRYLDGAPG